MIELLSNRAMVMNFPDWFYFACVLLFSARSFRDSFPSTFTLGDVKNQKSLEEGALCSAAARYIAWILDPISKSHQDMLAEYLTKIAGSFTPKQFGSDKHNKAASSYNTKLKKPKVQDDIKGYLKEYDFQIIQLWLKEFQEVYIRYSNSTVNSSSEAKAAQAIRLGQNVFFRRISLGILIGCSDQINEDGCELLLHYTATGTIFQSTNTQSVGLRHKRRNSELQEGFIKWIENCNRKEAEKGACLVFHLTDVTENMLASLCETEESEVDFICRVKSRAGKYLVKCVRRLLQLKVHEDVLMKRDLHNRLVRWRQQGKDVLHGYKDLDEVIDAMSNTLSSM